MGARTWRTRWSTRWTSAAERWWRSRCSRPTGVGYRASVGSGYCGNAARSWNGVSRTGGMRRVHLRRHPNILKRLLVHVAAFNLGLVMRQMLGRGTPRGLQGCPLDLLLALLRLLTDVWTRRLGSEGYGDRFEPNFGLSEPSNYTLLAIAKDAPSTTGC